MIRNRSELAVGATLIAALLLSPTLALAAGGVDAIDDQALRAAESATSNWITHGRTYGEQRYSPLDEIDDDNIGRLHLDWTFETGLTRGHEATPIVVDGVLYFTGSWSNVFAVDGRTGKKLWHYDPEVPRETGKKACCDVVNRGVGRLSASPPLRGRGPRAASRSADHWG